mmetsp:Transcript_19349/g.43072  ORF Transcript_19349/g.43072 Transcript_19349/m.43072 type:complete len:200 (-) Transcript_19349:377-976(-)
MPLVNWLGTGWMGRVGTEPFGGLSSGDAAKTAYCPRLGLAAKDGPGSPPPPPDDAPDWIRSASIPAAFTTHLALIVLPLPSPPSVGFVSIVQIPSSGSNVLRSMSASTPHRITSPSAPDAAATSRACAARATGNSQGSTTISPGMWTAPLQASDSDGSSSDTSRGDTKRASQSPATWLSARTPFSLSRLPSSSAVSVWG